MVIVGHSVSRANEYLLVVCSEGLFYYTNDAIGGKFRAGNAIIDGDVSLEYMCIVLYFVQ